MKRAFFHLLHEITGIFSKLVGKIHSPWTHKKLTYKHVVHLEEIMEPGDILITRTNGELTTLVVPGFWKHAAIYMGNSKTVDAVFAGVSERWLADLIMSTDYVAVMRVKDIDVHGQVDLIEFAQDQIGKPYDFEMRGTDISALYCSELVLNAVNVAMQDKYLELRERLGVLTFTPNDCYSARKKFDLIWESEK